MPMPANCFLKKLEKWRIIDGRQTWRDADGRRVFTWDDLHGEVESFDRRGRHVAVLHPVTGEMIKDAVHGRRLDIK
jgi:hypothetical protein